MLIAPNIDPIALRIGPLAIHWYGLMYVASLLTVWWGMTRLARKPGALLNPEQVSDLIFYGAIGVILGGRLGEVLFYNPGYYFTHPLAILRVWEGGMSFHGGFLGVVFAVWWYARKQGKTFWALMDFVAPWTPIGLGLGRLGNFINQELWGRATDVPWAMVFRTGGPLPRHPSQLYELALEGVALFAILWWYTRKPRPAASVSALFAVCYGVFRFSVEFVREPDANLGFLAFGWLTMGQLLSLPLIAAGAGVLLWAYRKPRA